MDGFELVLRARALELPDPCRVHPNRHENVFGVRVDAVRELEGLLRIS